MRRFRHISGTIFELETLGNLSHYIGRFAGQTFSTYLPVGTVETSPSLYTEIFEVNTGEATLERGGVTTETPISTVWRIESFKRPRELTIFQYGESGGYHMHLSDGSISNRSETLQSMLSGGGGSVADGQFVIQSVRRLSDGVVFAIGDNIKIQEPDDPELHWGHSTITKFNILANNHMNIHTDYVSTHTGRINSNGFATLEDDVIKVEQQVDRVANTARTWMESALLSAEQQWNTVPTGYTAYIDPYAKTTRKDRAIKEVVYVKPKNGKYTIKDIQEILKRDAGMDETDINQLLECFKKEDETNDVKEVVEKVTKPIDAIAKVKSKRNGR